MAVPDEHPTAPSAQNEQPDASYEKKMRLVLDMKEELAKCKNLLTGVEETMLPAPQTAVK